MRDVTKGNAGNAGAGLASTLCARECGDIATLCKIVIDALKAGMIRVWVRVRAGMRGIIAVCGRLRRNRPVVRSR
ncbi:hypothetical protein J6590_063245 [Homalodisca vitripennis]|nr:hypothetical protein J6590_063245 [Homalodisca vitripennis]